MFQALKASYGSQNETFEIAIDNLEVVPLMSLFLGIFTNFISAFCRWFHF